LGSGLLIHRVQPRASNPLAGLPASEPVNTGATTTVTANATVPAGLGAAGVSIDVGDTSGFTEIPGRIYVGGVPMYCQDSTPSSFRGCVTSNPSAAAARVGESVGTDPVIPPGAGVTSGLVAPDGLVAQVPGYRPPGAPRGAVTVMYVDKQLDYFAPASTTSALALGGTVNLPVTATSRFTSFPVTVHLGTGANSNPGPIVAVTCTGASGNSELTGCTGGSGTVAGSSLVGAPGACVTPYSNLAKIGEGKNKPTSLFKNNEDYANVQQAWTVDGVHFHDPSTTNPVTGLADPTSATGLRFVAPGGAIVHNPDGTLGLFFAGGYCSDGDSDGFHAIFYSTSGDGQHWSTPTPVISTDPTLAASAAQQRSGGTLGVSAYYSGRAYSPSVVQLANGDLIMSFAGYRTPKPLPTVGTSLGTNPTDRYTVGQTDPALYRSILTVGLQSSCLKSEVDGPLTVKAGTSLCVAAGTIINGPIVVQPGGSLYLQDATVRGPVTASRAAALRICGSTLDGGLSVRGTTGAVVVADTNSMSPCNGNRIGGPVALVGNLSGARFVDNVVGGPLSISGPGRWRSPATRSRGPRRAESHPTSSLAEWAPNRLPTRSPSPSPTGPPANWTTGPPGLTWRPPSVSGWPRRRSRSSSTATRQT